MSGADRRSFFRSLASASAMSAGPHAAEGARAPLRLFDVTQHGAVGDGRRDDTVAIQRALDACAAAGGGVVLVPAGRYRCGALHLRSHLHLELGPGSRLEASQRPEDFPPMPGRWEGVERTTHASLLTGVDLEDVTIAGAGTLDGRGQPWWAAHDETVKLRTDRKLERQQENPPDAPLRWPRPRIINLIRCRRVRVADVLFKDSPSYNLHFTYCQDVVVEGVTIDSNQGSNCCGIILDSSRRARVFGCLVDSHSDAIGIKAGYNEDGRRVNQPCSEILVSNCQLMGGNGGGISLGSETTGDIRDVVVSNCLISASRMGVHVRNPRGRGGTIERVRISNVIMREVSRAAIAISHYYDSVRLDPESPRTAVEATALRDIFDRPLPEAERNPVRPPRGNPETDRSLVQATGPTTPTLRNFVFRGLTLDRVQAVAIVEGLPERFIRGLTIAEMTVSQARTGIFCWRVAQVRLSDITFEASEGLAISVQDAQRLEISRLSAGAAAHRTVVQLENVDGAFVHGCDVGQAGAQFLRQVGEKNRGVLAEGNYVGEE